MVWCVPFDFLHSATQALIFWQDVEYGGSIARYATDPVINLTLMALIVIGSLGFTVWGEIRLDKTLFQTFRLRQGSFCLLQPV